MAAPLTADAFLAALKAEGVRVQEHPGWRTHNRTAPPGRPWGPVHGVVVHHTVSTGSANTVRICRDGYAGLPGPLCQGVITKDGVFHLIGYGRCNHAGGGDPDVLAAVQAESYDVRPPVPNVGNTDGIDGNARFYGWECENLGDGKDPWTDAQLDTIERASAAVCRAHGWSAKSVIGHKEWSDDKSDPAGFTMPWIRGRIAARLAGTTTPPEEDMATPAEIAAAVWNHTEPNPVAGGAPVRMGAVQRYMDYVHGKQTSAIEAVPATVLTPEQVTAVATQAASQVAGSAALVEAIAEKVAAKLAARLAQ